MANKYQTIHTAYGLMRLAEAQALGTKINLPTMAVGDGGGNFVTPSESMTQLVSEKFRDKINRLFQDPTDNKRFIAELVVPVSAAGFTLREVALFDESGSLFAIGNLPDTYKPNISEGAYTDSVVRLEFMAANADVITLQLDPNVMVATQAWISNNVTAKFLLPGGTTGQILKKKSNADGDVQWADPTQVNVIVNTVEEEQTLAASQTTVDLVQTNTTGLAIYINGERLPKRPGAGGWQPHGSIITKAILGSSYAAGTKLIAVQNEPASDLPDALVQSQNLADVPNKPLARQNLDVFSRDEVLQRMPVSAVVHFPRSTAPSGWLKCNGAAVSRTAYADLFAIIGTTFGQGDGFNTFNLPDYRGEFLRCWDDSRGVDQGRGINTFQGDGIKSHNHTASTDTQGWHGHSGTTSWNGDHQHQSAQVGVAGVDYDDGRGDPQVGSGWTGVAGGHNHTLNIDGSGNHAHNVTVGSTGTTETRPRNAALLACIKF